MLVEPDLTEVTSPVPPGTYKTEIMTAEAKEWSTGTKYIAWGLQIFDNEKFAGRNIKHSTPIVGKGAFLLQNFYEAATGEALAKGSFDTDQLLNKEVIVTLVQKVRDGVPNKWAEVDSVTPIM